MIKLGERIWTKGFREDVYKNVCSGFGQNVTHGIWVEMDERYPRLRASIINGVLETDEVPND